MPQTSPNPALAAIEGYDALAELALDLRWSWGPGTDEIWSHLDPVLWKLTRNPWVTLQTISPQRLQVLLANPGYQRQVQDAIDAKRNALQTAPWFQEKHAAAPLTHVAYFSMEFLLSEALPIYSGGLGNVAGDQLKAASDLGVPVVGVGLLYQQGYFRQAIDAQGNQQALYPFNDPGQLPVTPVRQADGDWLRLEIALPGYSLWLRAWQVRVGRLHLYLLDTNDAANFPVHRGICSELYGGNAELRLRQEMILGIGGWRLIEALGLHPEVCHLNEGHAAFAVLERARSFMRHNGCSFREALAITRAGNLFTTHTAVEAGFDRFSPWLMEQYLGVYCHDRLGIAMNDLLALGRRNPDDSNEPFNMAYLALRSSAAVNGVSRLHGQVSRELFSPLFPRWPVDEVPVGYVTNGVHVPTWDSAASAEFWTAAGKKSPWEYPPSGPIDLGHVPDEAFWALRTLNRHALVNYVREQLPRQLAVSGAARDTVEAARHRLDPNALTLGFSRRFATYKRPNLLLHDTERLVRLLTQTERPVQLVFAGKAHPADQPGQALIRQWMQFIERPEVRAHVIFLADYDMLLAQQIVQGVDVWINTPERPWEASGTSGMKVLVNGGINLSELDGWWAEAYEPELGWALGDGREHGHDPAWNAFEAGKLYDLIEHEVVPQFYDRDAAGLPHTWIARMRQSMSRLTPQFSATRTVQEYTEHYYLPAARAYHQRAADGGQAGVKLARGLDAIRERWSAVRFGTLTVETRDGRHHFSVEVSLPGLDPEAVKVELYANAGANHPDTRIALAPGASPGGLAPSIYTGDAPADRPVSDFTPRAVPSYPGASVPLEAGEITWQH
ncbi:MAG: alpha-glucan family phosphorylase [Verrucomicrobiota bacterium]